MRLYCDEQVISFDPGFLRPSFQVPWSSVRTLARWMDADDFPFLKNQLVVSELDDSIQLLRLPSGISAKESVRMSDEWRRRCPDDQREAAFWALPNGQGATLAVQTSRWLEAMRGSKPLVHVGWGKPLPFPEAFLRAPDAFIRDAFPTPLVIPEEIDGADIRAERICRESDAKALITGVRKLAPYPGSPGDHTAAVFETTDAGAHWNELDIHDVDRAKVSWGEYSWPPENIDGIRYEQSRPTIYFEDPWIDWEPGSRWRARYDYERERWVAEYIDDGWFPSP
jgi:hypothetical protein